MSRNRWAFPIWVVTGLHFPRMWWPGWPMGEGCIALCGLWLMLACGRMWEWLVLPSHWEVPCFAVLPTCSIFVGFLQWWRREKKDFVYLQQWVPKCWRNACHSSPDLVAAAHLPARCFAHTQISLSNATARSVRHSPAFRCEWRGQGREGKCLV